MKFTSKSKFKTIFILFLALAVTLSVALWGIFRTRNSTTAVADTGVGAITSAMNDATADWQTQTEIYIWSGVENADDSDEADTTDTTIYSSKSEADVPSGHQLVNGAVFEINPVTDDNPNDGVDASLTEIRIKSGAQVTVNAAEPSVKRELEGNATYTQIIFDVPVVVEAEAVLTLNADVVFRAGVTVYGTLIINGMAFNQAIPGADGSYTTGEVTIDDEGAATVTSGMMYIANEVNSYAQIRSEGVIVNGSLNNDAARGGAISIAEGATLTVSASTQTEYNNGTGGTSSYSNHDGGALFLKGDDATSPSFNLTVTVGGTLQNNGSIIYETLSGISAPSASAGDGAIVGATFVSAFPTGGFSSDTVYVFYPAASATGVNTYGTALSITNGSTRSWSGFSLLSFGRTTITNSGAYSYSLSDVNLGGGTTSEGKTYTQGANELIFDGGAKWEETTSQDNNRDAIYNLGASSNNQGDHSVTDLRFFNGGDNEQNYTNKAISSNEALMVVS